MSEFVEHDVLHEMEMVPGDLLGKIHLYAAKHLNTTESGLRPGAEMWQMEWQRPQSFMLDCFWVFITLMFMFGANFILRLIGNSGASVISRVMGLILASVAVANILEGIKEYFLI